MSSENYLTERHLRLPDGTFPHLGVADGEVAPYVLMAGSPDRVEQISEKMDEISISAPTNIAELKDGEIKTYKIEPEQFGMQRADISTLVVENVEESFNVMQAVLDNQSGPTQDIVLLNAGAAIYTAGIEDTLATGIASARQVIENGSASSRLNQLVKLTQSF